MRGNFPQRPVVCLGSLPWLWSNRVAGKSGLQRVFRPWLEAVRRL